MFADVSMIPSTTDANVFTEDESAVVTRCSSNSSASGSSSSLGGGASSPPMPTPPRSSSGSLLGSASDSEGSPPRQPSPQYFHAKESPTTPHSVPSDDCALPLVFGDPVLSASAASSTPAQAPAPAHTVLHLVQPMDAAPSAANGAAYAHPAVVGAAAATTPTRYLLVQQTQTVPRIVAICNPAGGMPPVPHIAKARLIVAPATASATGATSVTGSVVAPVPQTQKKASARGIQRVSPSVRVQLLRVVSSRARFAHTLQLLVSRRARVHL